LQSTGATNGLLEPSWRHFSSTATACGIAVRNKSLPRKSMTKGGGHLRVETYCMRVDVDHVGIANLYQNGRWHISARVSVLLMAKS
jgi:hypothetical protein